MGGSSSNLSNELVALEFKSSIFKIKINLGDESEALYEQKLINSLIWSIWIEEFFSFFLTILKFTYSLLDNLHPDPESTKDGDDHRPRQVRSGHFVPVTPKPLPQPTYISHSKTFFAELGLKQELALNEEFKKLFSGDLSKTREPMRPFGWATGYALSIYGTEYNQQCPF